MAICIYSQRDTKESEAHKAGMITLFAVDCWSSAAHLSVQSAEHDGDYLTGHASTP